MIRMMIQISKFTPVWACCLLLMVVGCQTSKPADFFQPVTLQERSIQTRVFETDDEIKILNACADLLLDNGFRIREVESRLGWIDAAKIKVTIYGGIYGAHASVVTRRVSGRPNAIAVRVIFHRFEKVDDAAVYQEFFLKLSQAVFIEAQEL